MQEIPAKMKFFNVDLLLSFCIECGLKDIIRYVIFRNINGENLILIIKSADFFQKLRDQDIRIAFTIDLKELLKVVDDPVPFLGDKLSLNMENLDCLHKFKRDEQFERIETLLGIRIDQLFTKLPKNYSYFRYRSVFRYLIQNGQKLPDNLPQNTLDLLKADFY